MSPFSLCKVHIERCKGFMFRVRKKESDIYERKKNERGNVKKITTDSQCFHCFSNFCQNELDRKQGRRKLNSTER